MHDLTCIPLLAVSIAHGGESTNPSALNPPTWWHVPTITPLIWTKEPVNMDTNQATEIKTFTLKPGKYQLGTYTFDFSFNVTLSRTLEFAKTLDQCVGVAAQKC